MRQTGLVYVTLTLVALCGCAGVVAAGESTVDTKDFRFTPYHGECARLCWCGVRVSVSLWSVCKCVTLVCYYGVSV